MFFIYIWCIIISRHIFTSKYKQMKQIILLLALSIFIFTNNFAQNISTAEAKHAAENKLMLMDKSDNYKLLSNVHYIQSHENQILAYAFDLEPSGYIIIASRKEIHPVIAYSFISNYIINDDQNPLRELLKADLQNRTFSIPNMDKEILRKRILEWNNLLQGISNKETLFQQWPPEGSTSTEGWLETNYTQSDPYNVFCPMDPVTSTRSYVGCPATAMAQILNYYRELNATKFTDADDYYHTYAGRNYWIDNDFEEHDFLSFPQINTYLAEIAIKFEENTTLNNNEKAALSFACGVAASQVFTSVGSGTFGVNQALDAYMKFSFSDAILLDGDDPNFYSTLSQNMMDARPAHLAVLNDAGNSGHNIVVDGYNTNDYYHVNFGWGGTYNGWYLIPEGIPYDLTVIEGVIANIAFPYVNTSVDNKPNNNSAILNLFPNPATEILNISTKDNKAIKRISIYNQLGEILLQTRQQFSMLNISSLSKGVYVLEAELDNMILRKKLICN